MRNYNVLIAGYDFEQKIHRGITFYGKALIRTLYEMNNDLFLLTSAKSNDEECLYNLNILRQLDDPFYLNNKSKLVYYLKNFFIKQKQNIILNNNDFYDNRLNYLNFIKYFYNIPYFYDLTTVHNRFFVKNPMKLKLNHKINLIITTSPMNIKSNKKIIQTLHDVIPLTCRYHPPMDDSKIFFYRIKNMLKYSVKVLSVSNFSKEECLKIFPSFEDKIEVVYQPIPIYENEKKLANDEIVGESILKKFKLTKDNYLFYVGMLEKRKNIKGLIEAFLAIYEKIKIPLVLAGGLGYGQEEFISYLKDKKLKKKIKYIGYINNIEKLVLLKYTRAFLFPSFNEGFGLPPLEAMMMDTNVLTSNVSALPEVCGEAALLIDPYNINELAYGIEQITLNETLRNNLKKYYSERIKKFSYKNFQNRLLKVYDSVL